MKDETEGLSDKEDYVPYDQLTGREKLTLSIWDAWKDAYGFRPRHIDFDSMSDLEIQELYRKLCYNFALTDIA